VTHAGVSHVGRRRFTGLIGGACASAAFGFSWCQPVETGYASDGRLTARPASNAATTAKGRSRVNLWPERDGLLSVPRTGEGPWPLLVLFHGAGGSAEGILRRLGAAAEDAGIVVLAPESRGETWDAIRGEFGRDVDFVNRALQRTFERVAVDPARIAAGGFSDGATYALSLGTVNGDLFQRIAAFSPGFVVGRTAAGRPRIFVSHGLDDDILPIDRCSRRIVPALQRHGYDVTFREFKGGHEVPDAVAREGMSFVAARDAKVVATL
jgi:phospholipase/carboxylesterase